jgi:hypothetical protein
LRESRESITCQNNTAILHVEIGNIINFHMAIVFTETWKLRSSKNSIWPPHGKCGEKNITKVSKFSCTKFSRVFPHCRFSSLGFDEKVSLTCHKIIFVLINFQHLFSSLFSLSIQTTTREDETRSSWEFSMDNFEDFVAWWKMNENYEDTFVCWWSWKVGKKFHDLSVTD